MKKLSISLLTIFVSLTATSAFAKFDQTVNDKVCEIVKNDEKDVLNRTIKSIRLSMNTIYENVNCQGQNILQFSISNQAANVGEYIIKKTSKNVLAQDAGIYTKANPELAQAQLINAVNAKIES